VKLTLADVERCLLGAPEEGHESVTVKAVQTDSRAVEKGDLFICIGGENFDGHEFAEGAIKSGAVAVVADRMLDDIGAPVLMVRDTVQALGRLAACWRDMCGAKLIAVTGTAGKTTVKEMLHAVISRKFETAKNYRNFNNQIGLPVSMLKATTEQPIWIMELGISVRDDMEELAPVASPDIAVITNVGPGHLEGLGDEAGVATAKTTLLRFLREGGVAVTSADYPLLRKAAREIVGEPIEFSTGKKGTSYVASFLGGTDREGWGRFTLRTPEGDGEFDAPFNGEHYAENLACVAAVCAQVGITRAEVIEGVQAIDADPQRFCCKEFGCATLINDTYNANPLSTVRSIRTAKTMAGDRPLVLVLGEMRELGAEAEKQHEELGRVIKEVAPLGCFYKGGHFEDVARGMGSAPVKLDDVDDFMKAWRDLGVTDPMVLVKGSRSLKMEEYAGVLSRALDAAAGTGENTK